MAKKTKSKTTVNVEAVRREASKIIKESQNKKSPLPGDMSNTHAELAPGSVQRQSPLEEDMGSSKYKQMIHDHNDKNKHILDRLPFTFPKKKVVRSNRNVVVECGECGYRSSGSEYTYMKSCPECKKTTKVINPDAEVRGEDRDFTPGFLATASDILRMKEAREKKKSQ